MNKPSSALKLIGGIFTALGAISFIVLAILCVNVNKFNKTAKEVTAVITDISYSRDSDGERHGNAFVSFEFDGKEYNDVRLNYFSSSMNEGDEITLLVNPEKPRNVRVKGEVLYIILPVIFGVVFGTVGAILLIAGLKGDGRKKLRETGRLIYGVVDSIEQEMFIEVNGSHPYVIICSYTDPSSGIVKKYKSQQLFDNPLGRYNPGDSIRIYLDPEKEDKYYVDLEN